MLIPILQIIVAILLVILILLQERSAGMSGLLGGDGGGFYQARRGLEKIVLVATAVLAVIFVGLAVIELIY